MTRPVLVTPRLELRPMTPAHLPLLHTLDSDAEVMRYLTGRARTPEEIDAFWGGGFRLRRLMDCRPWPRRGF